MTDKKRVLLVDDHEMARKGLRAMLSAADWLEVVGEADSCDAGATLAADLRPDIVLLDIRMPGTDGLSCLDRMTGLDPPTAVVIVTLYNERRYVLEAVRRGAAGYLLKDASTEEVIGTLAKVADGQLSIAPDLLRDALTADEEPAQVVATATLARRRADEYSITQRERQVLSLVAQGLTNKEIGARLAIAEDTVKKHVQNLIWKLRAADRTQAAITALRLGMLDHGD